MTSIQGLYSSMEFKNNIKNKQQFHNWMNKDKKKQINIWNLNENEWNGNFKIFQFYTLQLKSGKGHDSRFVIIKNDRKQKCSRLLFIIIIII